MAYASPLISTGRSLSEVTKQHDEYGKAGPGADRQPRAICNCPQVRGSAISNTWPSKPALRSPLGHAAGALGVGRLETRGRPGICPGGYRRLFTGAARVETSCTRTRRHPVKIAASSPGRRALKRLLAPCAARPRTDRRLFTGAARVETIRGHYSQSAPRIAASSPGRRALKHVHAEIDARAGSYRRLFTGAARVETAW
jgi:hypothetical protein